jgi:membrane-bound lytic murein transglycosylase A
LAGSLLLLLAACAPAAAPPPRLTLAPVRWDELPGWAEDAQAAALPPFLKSCAVLPESLGIAGRREDWRSPCAAAAALGPAPDDAAMRQFFESNFRPYAVGNNGAPKGLFTGYYEAAARGARLPHGPYRFPLLRRPPDLVTVDLGAFRPAWRGERTAGRVKDGRLIPYPSRAEIEAGALDAGRLALVWLDDPVDRFFLQIQGSGRVALAEGGVMQVQYDGQNGHPYVAIGKLLADRGAIPRADVTMAAIRAWLAAHPVEGKALMAENPSYVFFREGDGNGPIGSEGVVLTPGRSVAVDASFLPLGVPLWLDLDDGGAPLRRLVVAQDTGGAIRGPVRGDLFWGYGAEAERRAGIMRAHGAYYILLPKAVAPLAAPTAAR